MCFQKCFQVVGSEREVSSTDFLLLVMEPKQEAYGLGNPCIKHNIGHDLLIIHNHSMLLLYAIIIYPLVI